MKHFNFKKLLYSLLPFFLLATVLSCKNNGKNGEHEIVVTVDKNGKANGGHRFEKIDHSNFYIDDIKYTVTNGDLEVSGYDDAFFEGEAKIITQLNYDGRTMKVKAIGTKAFYKCEVLSSVVIPSSVTIIGESAFSFCTSMTSINIPNSVTAICDYGLFGCNKLTTINIPNSVTSIGLAAFKDCTNLKYVTLSNVASIGGAAFNDCSSLISVTVKMRTPVTIDYATFNYRGYITLYVPFGSKDAYKYTAYWSEFKEIIEE